MALRCFIAVEIPTEIKRSIGEIIAGLKRSGADVKWVSYENIHITLKFLGSTEENLVRPIVEALFKKLSPYPPFYIKIGGVGYFPPGRHPRVIWVGIEESQGLKVIWNDVEKEMVRLGFPAEDRPFSPHLTIGRVRSQKGVAEMLRMLEEYKGVGFPDMGIEGISLMKSDLKPAGPEYSRLAEITLKSGGE